MGKGAPLCLKGAFILSHLGPYSNGGTGKLLNYENFLARSLRSLAYIYLTSYNFVSLSVTIFDNLF